MKLFLAAFGRAGSPFVKEETERYVTRLKRSPNPLEIVELKESKRSDKQSALEEEAILFEKRFPKKDFVRVILAGEGKSLTTVSLAHWIEKRQAPHFVFLIGSAYGIAPSIKQSADLLLSLSALTLTHDHARVLAAEQLYRCMMILSGHPYHHE